MPNWCLNELTVTSCPKDRGKLKALMFDAKTGEFDFGLVCPRPKAFDGMLLRDGDKAVFNKALDSRLSLMDTDLFIALLRLENTKRDAKLDGSLERLIRENVDDITNDPVLKKADDDVNNLYDNDVFDAELLFINALERELKAAPRYSPTASVEDILEDLLNAKSAECAGNKEVRFDFQFLNAAVDSCTTPIRYAVRRLYTFYAKACTEAYNSPDIYAWNTTNWGTKWSPYNFELLGDFTHVIFDTAWLPPLEWMHKLAAKAEEHNIQGFSATLRYAEGAEWFGGEFYITSPDEYSYYDFDDNQLKEFLEL